MDASPLLTICVPTHNRADHLEKLLLLLEELVKVGNDGDIEVIVVNNCSTDRTRAVLDSPRDPPVKAIHRDVFLLTAEENIIHSLQYCAGRFVWFLGDDDVPVAGNFSDHLARLREDRQDYYFFNPAFTDPNGTLLTMQLIPMNGLEFVGTTVDLMQLVGCTFAFAGISNHVVRRSLLSFERGLHYMDGSRIYSLVAWMIEAGARARAALINQPLVYYRENDYDPRHWPRIAERMDVGDFYFWGLGLMELFLLMARSGCIALPRVGDIFEVRRDGSRMRLLDEMIRAVRLQIGLSRTDPRPRQRLDAAQMRGFALFCMRVDGLSFDTVRALTALNDHVLGGAADGGETARLEARLEALTQASARLGEWVCRVRHQYRGYDILWTPMQHVAIRAGDVALREATMRWVDPRSEPPLVFAAPTHAELLRRIAAHRFASPAPAAAVAQPAHHDLVARLAAAETQLAAVYASRSWAFSYPVRLVSNTARRCLRLAARLRRRLAGAT